MMQLPRSTLLSAVLVLATTAAAQDAQSTFGHARARELAAAGRLPGARDVVVRDLVNYHHHKVRQPRAGEAVALDLRFDRDAAAPGEELWLQVGYATLAEGDRSLAKPCAVALVIDCSGSMQERGKMEQVQRGLGAFVARLRSDDLVAVVGFDNEARLITPLRRRDDGGWLQTAIAQLVPAGSTNLHAGAMRGLDELMNAELLDGGAGDRTRRLVLLTDGIANAGVTEPAQIAADVARRAGTTVDVSTIGVGADLDTTLLQQLARQSRGLFHFVADEQDVQKVFVAEADSLLVPVARQLELRVELPPGLIAEQVYDESRADAPGVVLQLPDLNAAVTGVVMVRCRVDGDGDARLPVTATLRFTPADGHAPVTVTDATTLRRGRPQAHDVEVRKNAAIALLADGLAAMARCCDQRRWSDAAAALQRATDRAQQLFPGNDADLQRVRDIATGHRDTLRRYVERFRDL